MSSQHNDEMTTEAFTVQEISSVIKRDGNVVPFNSEKITEVLKKAFINNNSTGDNTLSTTVREQIDLLTKQIVVALHRRGHGVAINIEDIQDQVELALMRSGEHQIARHFVIYREKRQTERAKEKAEQAQEDQEPILYYKESDKLFPLSNQWLRNIIKRACVGLEDCADQELIFSETKKNLYNEVPLNEVHKALILAARALIEYDPAYSKVTARLLLHTLYAEVKTVSDSFQSSIKYGIEVGRIHPELATFDLDRLSKALVVERDLQFEHLGMQTLYDRYFLHHNGIRFELPQGFFMRVAMGLAIHEKDREEKAIGFYHVLSTFDFMSSTPTLFNSGTLRPQLSSCFLTTIGDSLEEI
jgi:ribonucleoside-diphosphate reductase alpha chain